MAGSVCLRCGWDWLGFKDYFSLGKICGGD